MTDLREAAQRAERIFDALQAAQFMCLPPDVWGHNDLKRESIRLILQAGFDITGVIEPIERKQRRRAPNSGTSRKRKKKKRLREWQIIEKLPYS